MILHMLVLSITIIVIRISAPFNMLHLDLPLAVSLVLVLFTVDPMTLSTVPVLRRVQSLVNLAESRHGRDILVEIYGGIRSGGVV